MRRIRSASRVLELKEREKEQKEIEVKQAREAADREQERLDVFERTIQETMNSLREKQADEFINAQELGLFYDYCAHMDVRIELQKIALDRCSEELETKEKALLEAYKEKRALELFRDRLLSQKTREDVKTEQKQMDAVVLSRRAFKE